MPAVDKFMFLSSWHIYKHSLFQQKLRLQINPNNKKCLSF